MALLGLGHSGHGGIAVQQLSYVGFAFLMPCVLVGAYIILRWGFVGVSIIWSQREKLDEHVRAEVAEITRRRQESR